MPGVIGNKNAWRHGGVGTPEYSSWESMLDRCRNPNNKRWARYGGRGIAVCARWRTSFADFLVDMGPQPKGLTLDRINNDGNYEPGNCRWATRTEQARNARHVTMVEWHGRKVALTEVCETVGVKVGLVRERLYRGWPLDRALAEPSRPNNSGGRWTGAAARRRALAEKRWPCCTLPWRRCSTKFTYAVSGTDRHHPGLRRCEKSNGC